MEMHYVKLNRAPWSIAHILTMWKLVTVRQPFWKHVTVSIAPSTKSDVIVNINTLFIRIVFSRHFKAKDDKCEHLSADT